MDDNGSATGAVEIGRVHDIDAGNVTEIESADIVFDVFNRASGFINIGNEKSVVFGDFEIIDVIIIVLNIIIVVIVIKKIMYVGCCDFACRG